MQNFLQVQLLFHLNFKLLHYSLLLALLAVLVKQVGYVSLPRYPLSFAEVSDKFLNEIGVFWLPFLSFFLLGPDLL